MAQSEVTGRFLEGVPIINHDPRKKSAVVIRAPTNQGTFLLGEVQKFPFMHADMSVSSCRKRKRFVCLRHPAHLGHHAWSNPLFRYARKMQIYARFFFFHFFLYLAKPLFKVWRTSDARHCKGARTEPDEFGETLQERMTRTTSPDAWKDLYKERRDSFHDASWYEAARR